jgi:hypothetical protein
MSAWRGGRVGTGIALWCGLLCIVAAPGEAAPRPKLVNPPRALGQLIPSDAVVLVYLRSVDDAEQCVRALQRDGGGDSLEQDILGPLLKRTGVRPERVHRRRPLAVALSTGGLDSPVQVTLILPLADRRGFDLDRKFIPDSKTVVVKGDYAGISALPGYAASRAPAAFATQLLDAPIAARLRPHQVAPLARFVSGAAVGRMLEQHCPEGAALSDSAAVSCQQLRALQGGTRGLCDALDALEAVDLGLSASQGVAVLGFVLSPLPGHRGILPTGQQAQAVVDLARCLPHQYASVSLTALDFASLAAFLEPLAAASQPLQGRYLPAPWRELQTSVRRLDFEMMKANSGGMLTATDFGPRGFEWIDIQLMTDAERVAARHRQELLEALPGQSPLQLVSDPVTTMSGTPVYTYRMRLDSIALPAMPGADSAAAGVATGRMLRQVAQLLGSQEVVARLAAVHDKLCVVVQPDPACLGEILALAQQPGAPMPGWLRPELASPPDTLCWYARIDLQALLPPLAAVLSAAPGAEKNVTGALQVADPAPVTLRGTIGRGIYRGEVRADIQRLRDLFAILGRMQPGITGASGSESPPVHKP